VGQWTDLYPMEFKVVTLRYSPVLGALDDAPLLALARDHEVLGVREHFFVVHDVPHLVCLVSCQPRTAQAAATATPATRTTPASASALEPVRSPPEPAAHPSLPPSPSSAPARSPFPELTPDQQRLFEAIRRWRYETARHDGVPPYVILTNRNLLELVRERPDSLTGLGRVRGIGKAKVERYGAVLLALLHGEPPATAGPTLVPVPPPVALGHDQDNT
jgi:HRDC domain